MNRSERGKGADVIRTTTMLAALALSLAGGGAGATRTAGPPPGLTSHGRAVWNLDALLHDTFGRRPVYLNAGATPKTPRNFSTRFTADCCSSYYLYTFTMASGSAFKTTGP